MRRQVCGLALGLLLAAGCAPGGRDTAPAVTTSATVVLGQDSAVVAAIARAVPELAGSDPAQLAQRARAVCVDVEAGKDVATVSAVAAQRFTTSAAPVLSNEQGRRLVAAVRPVLCP